MKIILFAGVFIVLISCGQSQTSDKVEETIEPTFSSEQLSQKLEIALKEKNLLPIDSFFKNWNTIKPNSSAFITQSDSIAAVFAIFKEFYRPLDLLKLGDWEWKNELNSNCRYVVVQDKIFYLVLPTDSLEDFTWETSHRDSINNFRPPINLRKNQILYLTAEHEKAINKFLGTESTDLGDGGIMNPSRPKGESEKRYEILRKYIPILHGHWGGYWHIATHPLVSAIFLNKSLTKAKITFRVGYQGGEAILEKIGSNWIINESKTTWIE